ncbi:MAG: hypothetical protein Q8M88_07745, partial [Phenylobacterium sp.]|nr:hypothetical protein [Phenylobacterium sp.]
MSLTLGLLAGASPAAALKFLTELQASTPVNFDRDHIRVIADINPGAPDRDIPGAGGVGGAGARRPCGSAPIGTKVGCP